MTRITGTFHDDQYTFLIITLSLLLRMRNVSGIRCRVNQNTLFVFSNFSLKSCFLRDMWKNIVERGRSQMTIRRMRISCWIPKAANTHSEYVTLLFHCNNGCKNAPRNYVIRTFAYLVKDYLYLIILCFVFCV